MQYNKTATAHTPASHHLSLQTCGILFCSYLKKGLSVLIPLHNYYYYNYDDGPFIGGAACYWKHLTGFGIETCFQQLKSIYIFSIKLTLKTQPPTTTRNDDNIQKNNNKNLKRKILFYFFCKEINPKNNANKSKEKQMKKRRRKKK